MHPIAAFLEPGINNDSYLLLGRLVAIVFVKKGNLLMISLSREASQQSFPAISTQLLKFQCKNLPICAFLWSAQPGNKDKPQGSFVSSKKLSNTTFLHKLLTL